MGDISVRCIDSGRLMVIQEVLYSKELRHNLLSVSKIEKKVSKVEFSENRVVISKLGIIYFSGIS